MALAERQTGGTLSGPMPRRTPYTQPSDISATTLKELLADRGRGSLDERQFDLLRKPGREGGRDDVRVFLAGETKWRTLTYVPPLAPFLRDEESLSGESRIGGEEGRSSGGSPINGKSGRTQTSSSR